MLRKERSGVSLLVAFASQVSETWSTVPLGRDVGVSSAGSSCGVCRRSISILLKCFQAQEG